MSATATVTQRTKRAVVLPAFGWMRGAHLVVLPANQKPFVGRERALR